eukprot:1190567-Prorocentrum_minimum.AAC.1
MREAGRFPRTVLQTVAVPTKGAVDRSKLPKCSLLSERQVAAPAAHGYAFVALCHTFVTRSSHVRHTFVTLLSHFVTLLSRFCHARVALASRSRRAYVAAAARRQVRRAAKFKKLKVHPDKTNNGPGSSTAVQRVKQAEDTLFDPDSRNRCAPPRHNHKIKQK